MFHLTYDCDNIMNLANQNAISISGNVFILLLCDCDTCAIRFLSYKLLNDLVFVITHDVYYYLKDWSIIMVSKVVQI